MGLVGMIAKAFVCIAASVASVTRAFAAFSGDSFLPASAPTNEAVVAVRVLRNNMPLVTASVDGHPCTFLFDTGATHTTLDRGFVERELKNHKLEKVVLAGVTNVEGAPSLMHAGSFKVGAAEFADFDMMVLDLAHLTVGIGERVDGVVGMNVIGRVMTLMSLGAGEVVFAPARSRLAGFTNAVERARSDPFSIAIKAGYGEREIPLIVDSAASMTFLGRETGWPTTDEKVNLSATDVNGIGSGIAPAVGKPGELSLGIPVSINPMVVAQPMNRIGADTLLRYDLLIGWRRVAFRPRREPKQGREEEGK